MLSEELKNLAAHLAALRQQPPAAMDRALRTAEELARDLAEDASHLERHVVPAAARATVLPPGVASLDQVRALRRGGAL